MRILFLNKTRKIKENIPELEKKLNVKILVEGRKVSLSGSEIDEYEAEPILEAISLGFSTGQAVQLKNEEFIFRKINIKDFTKRRDLSQIRARIVGTEGKTKRAIGNISNCEISLSGNTIGIIGSIVYIEDAITALKSLIKGSKQANVYKYLEKRNRERITDNP